MANQDVGGMKSLAVCLEAPDSNNDKIKEAWEYVKDMKALKFTDEAPSIEHDAPKKSEVGDMPMTPYTEVPGRRDRRMSSWVVDVIHDWHGEIDKSTSGRLATAGLYSQLQEPLSPKTDWGGCIHNAIGRVRDSPRHVYNREALHVLRAPVPSLGSPTPHPRANVHLELVAGQHRRHKEDLPEIARRSRRFPSSVPRVAEQRGDPAEEGPREDPGGL